MSAAEPTAGRFWSVMRHRNYALLWTGQLISQLGDRLHWMAISLWVYQETGSALSVSFAIMALLVGPAVVGLFAGAVVDRSDRRKILVYADLLRATLVFLIPELMVRSLHLVYLDLFLVSAATAFFRPAMFSAIPQSIPRGKLLEANALFASMDSGMEVIGPAIAGVVIVRFGYQAAMYLDALSFLLSAVFVGSLRLGEVESDAHREFGSSTKVPNFVGAIKEGFAYVKRDSVQMSLLALLLGGYWVAGLNSLQTPLAKGVLGISDGQFAWLQMSHGVGFIVAALLIGLATWGLPKGHVIVLSYILWALSVAAVGVSLNHIMLMVSNFWVGFANMLVFVGVATVIMEYTPGSKVGRVITMRGTIVAGMRAAALLGFGWLADETNARFAVVSMAALSLVGIVVATWKFPALARYHVVGGPWGLPPARSLVPGAFQLKDALSTYALNHADREFSSEFQMKLNIIVMVLLLAGWLAILATHTMVAIAIVAVTFITVVAESAARTMYHRVSRRWARESRRKL